MALESGFAVSSDELHPYGTFVGRQPRVRVTADEKSAPQVARLILLGVLSTAGLVERVVGVVGTEVDLADQATVDRDVDPRDVPTIGPS